MWEVRSRKMGTYFYFVHALFLFLKSFFSSLTSFFSISINFVVPLFRELPKSHVLLIHTYFHIWLSYRPSFIFLMRFLQMYLRVLASSSVEKGVLSLLRICFALCLTVGLVNISDERGTSDFLSLPTSTQIGWKCHCYVIFICGPGYFQFSSVKTPFITLCVQLNR
jgi:hypothetical protein